MTHTSVSEPAPALRCLGNWPFETSGICKQPLLSTITNYHLATLAVGRKKKVGKLLVCPPSSAVRCLALLYPTLFGIAIITTFGYYNVV